ncbi:mechanosensitive ion channel family protein [Planosporangium mesophilum]|uniref:Mechanosensitive ion channel protein MscS n=1 Tax=Planosporangium mesophilum TaxID=689768 RepID=A0A8J3X3L9_9ACTN|nr:mechanosensitive ion channel family protein [Planosporangium mesophilum]NJC86153.1 mechanosensitive ion channel family protein [Planosporangium mesophilum]GII22998.1 mechanosensitive ion channel protein MscS [Planosporangium mesophilum]
MARSVHQLLVHLLALFAAVGGALVVVEVAHHALLRLGRRGPFPREFARRAHQPLRWFAVVFASYATLNSLPLPESRWKSPLLHLLDLAVIAVSAWLIGVLLLITEDRALQRYRTDVRDNLHARRVHTRVRIIRRVTIAVIAVLTVAAMLTTFPNARTTGKSLLLSAGVVGVLAALAAQALLASMLAGVQLALSGAVRLEDVVIVEKEWGHVEEITLTHVVVRIWDDRRLVVPTSYFASHPFQNWTRTESRLLGTVELDVDWTVPLQPMREELQRIVSDSPLWDERLSLLQVTDATGEHVRVRCLVSAADADTLWDLRCLVRERLVEWLRDQQPQALPRIRTEIERGVLALPSRDNGRRPGSGARGARTA